MLIPIPASAATAPRMLLGSGWGCVFMEREMALSIWQRKGAGNAAEQRSFICSIGRVYAVLCWVSAFQSEKNTKISSNRCLNIMIDDLLSFYGFPFSECILSNSYCDCGVVDSVIIIIMREDRGRKGELMGCRRRLFIFRFTSGGISALGIWDKRFMYSHFSIYAPAEPIR